jgi:hypothetical protein
MNYPARLCLLLLCALPAFGWAEPFGYSVNSDQPGGDQLHRINLVTGEAQLRGPVMARGIIRQDVEGLAFDNNNVLWGVDDQTRRLFPIEPVNGQVDSSQDQLIRGLTELAGNDFGMTFTCEGELFITSVISQTLYRLGLDGNAVAVGNMGARIGAIAAIGKPTRLYGLGNGLLGENEVRDNRSLYEIDTATGAARLIGPLGDSVGDYFEGGLSFDEKGQLWALTDRRNVGQNPDLGSEILLIDPGTGQATVQSTTTVTGFESLAVAPPALCTTSSPPPLGPPGEESPELTAGIPSLDNNGRLLAIVLLMLGGMLALRRQAFSRP